MQVVALIGCLLIHHLNDNEGPEVMYSLICYSACIV